MEKICSELDIWARLEMQFLPVKACLHFYDFLTLRRFSGYSLILTNLAKFYRSLIWTTHCITYKFLISYEIEVILTFLGYLSQFLLKKARGYKNTRNGSELKKTFLCEIRTAVNSFGDKKSPELLQHILKIGLTKASPESQLSAQQLIIYF